MENFSPVKLVIFGLVFLFFFSIPVLTINQFQKVDNENKIKNILKQIETWGQIYKIRNGSFQGFENDVEIRMLKIDLIATTGGDMNIFFSKDYNHFCIKAVSNKSNTYCIDTSGVLVREPKGCFEGSGKCN